MRVGIGVAIAIVVCLLTGCSTTPVGNGLGPEKRLGRADWSSATTATTTARVLTVSADVSKLAPKAGCPTVTATATARESAETITVTVEALSRDYLGPAACGGSAYLSVPATVRLLAPVGHRTLIDARDGSDHAVLALDTVPTLKSLPPGFTKRGAGWDETTGVIYQWWRHSPQPAQIDLWEYPSTSAESVPALPRDPALVTIRKTDGHSAAVRLPPDTQEYYLQWTPAGQTNRLLMVTDQRTQRMTSTQALTLARAVG